MQRKFVRRNDAWFLPFAQYYGDCSMEGELNMDRGKMFVFVFRG